ncbi:hypothetical protein BH10PAT3_BH10PAT3_5470 [soil metagenome]
MLKKIKQTILTLIAATALLVPSLAVPVLVHAQGSGANIKDSLCSGVDLDAAATIDATGGTANCTTNVDGAGTAANGLIKNVINIFSLIVGVVAVIMIIVGGFRYITSGGNDGNVSGAKNTILYAVVGLIIVALAQIIVRFVLGKATAA